MNIGSGSTELNRPTSACSESSTNSSVAIQTTPPTSVALQTVRILFAFRPGWADKIPCRWPRLQDSRIVISVNFAFD